MKRLELRRRRLDTRAQLADKAGVGGQPAAEHDALHRRKARLKRAHGRSVEQIAVVAHRGAAVRERIGERLQIRLPVILIRLYARVHDQLADRVVIIQLQQRGECLRRRLAEPRLDRHRQRTGGKHGVEKPPQQIRLREQTCALFLHRDGVRRAAEVEVHLVVAHISELPRHPEKVLGAVAHELRHDTDTRVVRRLDLAQLARGKRAVRRRREKRRIVAVRRGERLPLRLPEITDFEPGPDGESPLARHAEWIKTTCPCCGGPATRETDTMPQWAGSSWYFLRYMDPHNKDAIASKEALDYWSPVDWYNGGMEHTTLHLLYSRFWHKFLYDIGVVPKPEPYQKRTSHGMILGLNPHAFENQPDAERKRLLAEYGSEKAAREALVEKYGEMAEHPIVKMSKSLGNVVNPDDVVNEYGADTLRLYEMFIGDFEKAAPWNTNSIKGCKRFLDRIWALSEKQVEGEGYRPKLEALINRTIKKVGEDIDALKANTAIAQLMILVNALYDEGGATRAEYEVLLQLLNPFVPHMTEELWQQMGHTDTLAYHEWPKYDEAKCVEQTIEIAVQVNGKVKARLNVAANIESADAIAAAKADPAVAEAIAGKTIAKEIYVKGRLVNIAVKG